MTALLRRPRKPRRGAFTIVELLVVIAAVATITTAVVFLPRILHPAGDAKLEGDVRMVNAAIKTYQMNGGSLEGISDPALVLAKLKTVTDHENQKDREIVGLTASMIDPRLQVSPGGSLRATGNLVARYDATKQRFEVVDAAGSDTFPGFQIGSPSAATVSEERTTTLKGARDGGWVWNYHEATGTDRPVHMAGTEEQLVADPSSGIQPGSAVAGSPVLNPAPPQTVLASYPLSVTITDPNPAGTTQLYYSVNGGSFVPYTGPVTANPGTTLRAVATTLDPDSMADSSTVLADYTPSPVTLALADTAPVSVNFFQAGGTAASGSPSTTPLGTRTITLTNADAIPAQFETSSNFQVQWTLAGTQNNSAAFSGSYPGESFTITRSLFGSGSSFALTHRAVSLNTTIFASSAQTSKTVSISKVTLLSPKFTSAAQITLAPDFASAVPANCRIYYQYGSDPGDNAGEPVSGTLYQSPLTPPAGGGSLYARIYPPSDAKAWFNSSTSGTLQIPSAQSNYMGDYNVIVFTDLSTTTAIEGKSWVGGTLTNTNSFSMGRNYSPAAGENVLVVGGTPGSGSAFSMEGNANSRMALVDSSRRGSRSINWNGGGSQSTRLVYDSTIPSKTATMQQQLRALSATLNGATANSTVVTPVNQSNKRVLTCSVNSDGVAIFNIAASSLFGASNLAEVTLGFASGVSESAVKGVLINVSGTTVQTGNQFNFGGKFTDDTWRKKILWNFPAATTLNMAAQRMDGAVLAPYASVNSNNDFKGSLVCNKLTISGSCFRLPFESGEVLATP